MILDWFNFSHIRKLSVDYLQKCQKVQSNTDFSFFLYEMNQYHQKRMDYDLQFN